MLQNTEDALCQLPEPPTKDPLARILRLLNDFIRELDAWVEGTPNPDGLLQSIRPHELTFKRAIRSTAPNFQPVMSPAADPESDASPYYPNDCAFAFLDNEEEQEFMDLNDGRPIYIDQVMKRAEQYVMMASKLMS